jgi:hypothetical protein
MIIRGHKRIRDGIDSKFNGKLLTVFGASNYCRNQSAVAAVETGELK